MAANTAELNAKETKLITICDRIGRMFDIMEEKVRCRRFCMGAFIIFQSIANHWILMQCPFVRIGRGTVTPEKSR